MASLTARLVRRLMRSQIKAVDVGDTFVEDLRARGSSRSLPAMLGSRVGQRPVEAGELGGVTGEWVGVPAARRHVLYLHGGYLLSGRTDLYRPLTGRIARGIGADVLLADYRLAPECPYPAAVDDGVAAYRALLDDSLTLVDRAREAGVRAELHRRDGLFHVWPAAVPFLPEARETVDEVVAFLDRELAA